MEQPQPRTILAEATYTDPDDAIVVGKYFKQALDKVDFASERLVIVFFREKIVPVEVPENGS